MYTLVVIWKLWYCDINMCKNAWKLVTAIAEAYYSHPNPIHTITTKKCTPLGS
jgi:hypothetical protein